MASIIDKVEQKNRTVQFLKDLIKRMPRIDDFYVTLETESQPWPNDNGILEHRPTGFKVLTIRWLEKE